MFPFPADGASHAHGCPPVSRQIGTYKPTLPSRLTFGKPFPMLFHMKKGCARTGRGDRHASEASRVICAAGFPFHAGSVIGLFALHDPGDRGESVPRAALCGIVLTLRALAALCHRRGIHRPCRCPCQRAGRICVQRQSRDCNYAVTEKKRSRFASKRRQTETDAY